MRMRRSWLVVPAHKPDALAYALEYLPDVLVLDLEYTVPPRCKEEARQVLATLIGEITHQPFEIFVRVDRGTRWCDLRSAIFPGLKGIVLPGAGTPEEIEDLDKLMIDLEEQRGIVPGSVELVLMLESAMGFWNAFALTEASRRVSAIGIGRVDLSMHLGPEPSGEFRLYRYLMTRTLSVARALGKEPLGAHFRPGSRGGIVSPDETLAAARRALREGFRGSFCAMPEQVAAVTAGFTPPQDEVAQARRIIAEFQTGRQAGLARPVIAGRTYDNFKVECLQQMVNFAEACTARDAEKPLAEGKEVSQ